MKQGMREKKNGIRTKEKEKDIVEWKQQIGGWRQGKKGRGEKKIKENKKDNVIGEWKLRNVARKSPTASSHQPHQSVTQTPFMPHIYISMNLDPTLATAIMTPPFITPSGPAPSHQQRVLLSSVLSALLLPGHSWISTFIITILLVAAPLHQHFFYCPFCTPYTWSFIHTYYSDFFSSNFIFLLLSLAAPWHLALFFTLPDLHFFNLIHCLLLPCASGILCYPLFHLTIDTSSFYCSLSSPFNYTPSSPLQYCFNIFEPIPTSFSIVLHTNFSP